MQIKIYFGDKPVYLCDEIDTGIREIMHHPDAVFIDELSHPAIKSLFHEIRKPEFHAGILYHPDLVKLRKTFWRNFQVVQAAGGLVENESGQVLMIFRRGKWDLPKGKMDPGETEEACAVREVKEETGLSQIHLLNKLTITYHTYEEFGKMILKESHWFRMRGDGHEKLVPQIDEDILDICWVEPVDIPEKLGQTFPSIIDVISEAGLLSGLPSGSQQP